jgi:hypothetical protein
MEPHIRAGDVVLSQALAAESPPPIGRVISFRAPAGSAKSGFVLHRLVAENDDGSLVTAGDSNANDDSTPLDRQNITSQARLLIPWIGLPAFWVTTGAFLPLGIWLLLTVSTILIEAAESATRQLPANPRRRFRLGRSPEDPGEGTHHAPPEEFISALFKRVRHATGPAAVALVGLLTAGALVTAPLGQAAAAFSARTSSAGNTWGTAGPATNLVFSTSPPGSTGGTAFATQPVVTVQDAGGNTVSTSSGSVTLTITTPAGATLACTANPRAAVSGVATFVGCRIDRAGTYTLTAASAGLTSAVSASLAITVGPATKIGFTASPSNTVRNTVFATQPRVAIQDAGGNTRTASSGVVTLSITTPAGATLTCTTNPRSTTSGVATFAGCRINTPGTYTLTATATGLTNAVSTSFAITWF